MRTPRSLKRCATAIKNSTDANRTVSRTYLSAVSRAAVPSSKSASASWFSRVDCSSEGFLSWGMYPGPGGAFGLVNGSVASHASNATR